MSNEKYKKGGKVKALYHPTTLPKFKVKEKPVKKEIVKTEDTINYGRRRKDSIIY